MSRLVIQDVPALPTPEQCSEFARLPNPTGWGDQWAFHAIWYPQMGGYVARAVIAFVPKPGQEDTPCFECWVWHAGDFPFDDDRNPAELHHCGAKQFVRFGREVMAMQRGEDPKKVDTEDGGG